jgi:hypothetical protein
MIITIKELLKQHPEWIDLPITIYRPNDGNLDWVGAAGSVSKSDTCLNDVSNEGKCHDRKEGCDNCPNSEIIDILIFSQN